MATPCRVVVLGARGLLGSTLVRHLRDREYETLSHSSTADADVVADLTDASQVRAALAKSAPDVVVNLVALTNVDACERDPRRAYQLNVRTVENVAASMPSAPGACHLVHLSTDQVYDGTGPHREDDIAPTNYYGFSKFAGELVAGYVPSTIVRTNFFGPSESPHRATLSDWVVDSLRQRRSITVFDDVRFSPLSLTRLVSLLELVIAKRRTGVFNLGSRDGMTKADFAFTLADALGLSSEHMTRGASDRTNLLAYRPKDMTMDSSRFEAAFDATLPSLKEEIDSVKDAYAS